MNTPWTPSRHLRILVVLAVPLLVTAFAVSGDAGPIAEALLLPRCDNCQTVQASLFECLHYAQDPDGAPCSDTACIQNVLDSASCQFHPDRGGDANCDTAPTLGPEIIQIARQSACPGGTVHWSDWRTIYSGCGTTCSGFTWRKACQTVSCTGPVIVGPLNRGQKKQCGC